MKKCHVFIIGVLSMFTACKPSLQKEMMKPLSEVDIYAAYPEKQMDIQQWAEVDYLPLSKKSFFSKRRKKEKTIKPILFFFISKNNLVNWFKRGYVGKP